MRRTADVFSESPVGHGFVTLTVRGGGRVVELPLPLGAPAAELAPVLARLCHGGRVQAHREGTPAIWALARPGSTLPLTASLAEAGLRDGDVLRLVDVSSWDARPRSGLGSVVGAAVELGPRWTGRATSRLLSSAAVAAIVVAAALAAGPAVLPLVAAGRRLVVVPATGHPPAAVALLAGVGLALLVAAVALCDPAPAIARLRHRSSRRCSSG